MSGVFISKGMTIAVPPGGLKLANRGDGSLDGNLIIHVRFDVCPTWIELAIQHLEDAKSKKMLRVAAWSENNEELKASTLEREFEASMQACMAAAIALDSFSSLIQTYVQLPTNLIKSWQKKRTARYSQVTEILRMAFQLKKNGTAALRQNLKEIYRFRNLAVHPTGKIKAPILHPELNVGVEWRFAYFHASNADLIVNSAAWILWDLAHNGKSNNIEITKYLAALQERLSVLFPDGHPSVAQKNKT